MSDGLPDDDIIIRRSPTAAMSNRRSIPKHRSVEATHH
jgi:hypothetical protein